MNRLTILKPNACDLKRLPLGAREAFVLAQVDGRLTLDEVAEIVGIDFDEVVRVAEMLVHLGAVSQTVTVQRGEASGRSRQAEGGGGGGTTEQGRSARIDPRADPKTVRPAPTKTMRPAGSKTVKPPGSKTMRPGSVPRGSLRPGRASMGPSGTPSAAPNAQASIRPSKPARHPTPRPEKRRSRKSVSAQRALGAMIKPPADEICELDEATVEIITMLDLRFSRRDLDFYALLEITRDADKKAIKRAYFAVAAKYHPDRFFGKKLGPVRAAIERIFQRATDASETLTDPVRRAAYDTTLPPVPRRVEPPPAPPAVEPTPPPPAPAAQAVALTTPGDAPPGPAPRRKSRLSKSMRVSSRQIAAAKEALAARPAKADVTGATAEERARHLRKAAGEIKVQSLIDALVQAAEASLKADDVVGAANNYRLALEHREDHYIRMRLEDIDNRAKTVRFERSVLMARAAERDNRWADAAQHYARANDIRTDAAIAERAANAFTMTGDGARAADLGEKAVDLDPKNVGHRVTFGKALIVAGRIGRAENELESMKDIAPKDERVKDFATLVGKARAKSKAKS